MNSTTAFLDVIDVQVCASTWGWWMSVLLKTALQKEITVAARLGKVKGSSDQEEKDGDEAEKLEGRPETKRAPWNTYCTIYFLTHSIMGRIYSQVNYIVLHTLHCKRGGVMLFAIHQEVKGWNKMTAAHSVICDETACIHDNSCFTSLVTAILALMRLRLVLASPGG